MHDSLRNKCNFKLLKRLFIFISYPNMCPHFNAAMRCSPEAWKSSKQIVQVAPSSSACFLHDLSCEILEWEISSYDEKIWQISIFPALYLFRFFAEDEISSLNGALSTLSISIGLSTFSWSLLPACIDSKFNICTSLAVQLLFNNRKQNKNKAGKFSKGLAKATKLMSVRDFKINLFVRKLLLALLFSFFICIEFKPPNWIKICKRIDFHKISSKNNKDFQLVRSTLWFEGRRLRDNK